MLESKKHVHVSSCGNLGPEMWNSESMKQLKAGKLEYTEDNRD